MAERLVTMGVDLGMQRDPSAYAVVECVDAAGDRWEVRSFSRIALGTEYARVVERLVEIVHGVEAKLRQGGDAGNVPVRVDATGVGLPVVQELRAALGPEREVTAVLFTHGHHYTTRPEWPPTATLGKAWLVSRLQALFGQGRLKLPLLHREAAAMKRELMSYEIHVDQDGDDKYGAFKVGAHDDLVTALGLAVLEAPQRVGVWWL